MNPRQMDASESRALIDKPPLAVMERPDGPSPSPDPDGSQTERIREAAYRLYEARGRVDGYAVDDWLAAEAELVSGTSASAVQASSRTPAS